jgi:threonine dehydrogenase-like Zn-dependent dehydrogenase
VGAQIEARIVELKGPRKLVFETKTLDLSTLKDGEIAAETLFSAISPGTEVAAYKGDPPLRPMKVYPRVVGYCNVAEIVACGRSVEKYEVGDRILSFQAHRSAFICPEGKIITKVPLEADLTEVATTYLFHLGYNALLKGDLEPGHNIAVVGLGTIGLTTVVLGNLFGANVYAFSNQDSNLKLAVEFGARMSFHKDNEGYVENINKDTDGTGIDTVISTSNSWKDWKLAISLPRKGGKVCVLGFPGRTKPIPDFNPLDSQHFYDQQLSLIACGYTPDIEVEPQDIRFTIKRNCKFLIKLITKKKIPAHKIISSVTRWDEIEQIYITMAEKKSPILTCVLKWK